ncbi:neprilysin-1-like isoform X2 [Ornithodoros turicata]|uniref:neprilysin-1-like isoform X2 n=1 Tax=Ornithodoros turicata TaxID=34597 RepID=UPI003138DC16
MQQELSTEFRKYSPTKPLSSKKDRGKQYAKKHQTIPAQDVVPRPEGPPTSLTYDRRRSRRAIYTCITIVAIIAAMIGLGYYVRSHFSAATITDHAGCSSDGCKKAAAESRKMVNETVSPCEDFYLHACGKWISKYEEHDWSYTDQLSWDAIDLFHATLYKMQLNGTEDLAVLNMQMFYKSCYDHIMYPTEVKELLPKVRDVLSLNSESLRRQPIGSLFKYVVRVCLTAGRDWIYSISAYKEDTGMILSITPARSLHAKLKGSTPVIEYLREVLEYDSTLLEEVAKLDYRMKYGSSEYDNTSLVTVQDLPRVPSKLSGEDWVGAINSGLYIPQRLSLYDSISVTDMPALVNITTQFFTEDKELVSAYIFAQAFTQLLQFSFNSKDDPKFTCLVESFRNFRDPVANVAATLIGTPVTQMRLREFIDRVRNHTRDQMLSPGWMDAGSRSTVKTKLNTLRFKFFKPNKYFSDPRAPKMTSNFLKNYLDIVQYNKRESIRYPLPDPARPGQLSAFYQSTLYWKDVGVVTMSITDVIDPLYMDDREDDFHNYATTGAAIARLLYQAALETESAFDSITTKIHSWTENARKSYNRSADCYISRFLQDMKFQGEDSADLRVMLYSMAKGLKVASQLAGLQGNATQRLFFYRYCQRFCSTRRDEATLLKARHFCEVPLVDHKKFLVAFDCGPETRLGALKPCDES